jgi:hypothetical protein
MMLAIARSEPERYCIFSFPIRQFAATSRV